MNNDEIYWEVAKYISNARAENGQSLREFASSLGYSHTIIFDWEAGRSLPNYRRLLTLVLAPDWRRDFALGLLAIIRPEDFQPDKEEENAA